LTVPIEQGEPERRDPARQRLEAYAASLRKYLDGDEAALWDVRETARDASSSGMTPSDLAMLHHAALRNVLSHYSQEQLPGVLADAGAVCAELLRPFEFGTRELERAEATLRRENDLLEQKAGQIAHALFDGIGQLVAALHLALEAAAGDAPQWTVKLKPAHTLLYQMEEQLRSLAASLRPTILDHLGLVPAIEHLAQQNQSACGISISVESRLERRVPPALELALYRAVEEALANVRKHAAATRVSILLSREAQGIVCIIRDDGVGFDVRDLEAPGVGQALGLSGIHERVRHLGGRLTVSSAPGLGTEICVVVPEAG
jgi:signal transduction histidine kinase